MFYIQEFVDCTAIAANILDEIELGWAEKINTRTLDMKSNEFCVLGQAFPKKEFRSMLAEIRATARKNNTPLTCPVFGCDKGYWLPEITKRVAAAKRHHFNSQEEVEGYSYVI